MRVKNNCNCDKKVKKRMFNFIIIGRNAIKTFNQIVKVFFLHKRSCQSPCKRSDYTNESTEWIVPKVSVDYTVKKCSPQERFLCHLDPSSWPWTTKTCGLMKTNKVVLLYNLEKTVELIASNVDEAVTCTDGMAMVQKQKHLDWHLAK